MFVPLTPLEFKRRAALLFGDSIGVVDGDARFTYREYGSRVDRLSAALHQLGLRRHDVVAYLAYNSHELLEGYYGVIQAGGILLPLNVRLTPEELAYIIDHAGVRLLLVEGDFLPMLDAILARVPETPGIAWLTYRPSGRDEPLLEELLQTARQGTFAAPDIDENDVAELFYTSGTTGRPKGVMLTHRSLYVHALANLTVANTGADTVMLHSIPLFHVNGWGSPQYVTAVGGRHVMLRRFDPDAAVRLIQEERVTHFFVVPTMLTMVINLPNIQDFDLSSLDRVNVGGSALPPDLHCRAEQVLGCQVRAGYGLTEASPVLTYSFAAKGEDELPAEERSRRRSSGGRPLVGVEVEVVDGEGHPLPHDGESTGEIVARGNTVMAGYWKDEAATAEALQGGWLHTGDVGVIDAAGYVHIRDRRKDIIISGGENIASAEIESVIFEVADVLECAVIAVPDEYWGEAPHALVVKRDGADVDEAALLAHCRERLASFKVPKAIEFRETLPKGGTGKILKAQLREPYWTGQERRVH